MQFELVELHFLLELLLSDCHFLLLPFELLYLFIVSVNLMHDLLLLVLVNLVDSVDILETVDAFDGLGLGEE